MDKVSKRIDPLAVSVAEAAQLIGLSRPKVYQLMQTGDFPSFKVGTRTLIPMEELRAWVAAQAEKREAM